MRACDTLTAGGFCLHPLSRPRTAVWGLLAFALAAAFVLELTLGSVLIPVRSVVAALLGDRDVPDGWRQIVLLFRLPRAVTAMLSGAALGMAGLKMQTLFRNPLTDPFILGISSGASLGVALLVMGSWAAGWSSLFEKGEMAGCAGTVFAATLGALAVLGVVLGIARRVESNLTLLIVGLMFGYITSSMVSILMQFSLEVQLQTYVARTFGSFGSVTWSQMPLFGLMVLIGLVMGWVNTKPLNAYLLGEGYARSMGVNVGHTRFLIILGASMLAGSVTAYCGPIGFLGIAVPHLCRLLSEFSPRELAQRMSLVFTERPAVGMMPVATLVALGRHPFTDWADRLRSRDREAVTRAMNPVGILDLAHRPMGELSDGERQKVMIARALAQEPRVMLLDEATAFLDLPRRVELMHLLRDLARSGERAILLSTHDLDLALRCADRLWLLPPGGPLQVGIPEDLVLRDTFSVTFSAPGISFDKVSGSFRFNGMQRGSVALRGAGVPEIWTARALERTGYSIVPEDQSGVCIELDQHIGWTEWRIRGRDSTHRSLESLLADLHLCECERDGVSRE